MATYQIHVLNYAGRLIAEVLNFKSISITDQANNVGSWKITARTIYRQPFEKNTFAVFYRDGVYIFGGPMHQVKETYDPKNKYWDWEVSGYGFNYILKNLCVFPAGLDDWPNLSAREFTSNTTPAATIYRLINENVCNAIAGRNTGWDIVSGVLNIAGGTDTVSLTCRFANLLQTCQSMATAGGLYILTSYDLETQKVTFVVSGGTDRSGSVIFSSDMSNVLSYSHTYTEPEYDYILMSYNSDDRSFANEGPMWKFAVKQPIYSEHGINQRELFVKPTAEQFESYPTPWIYATIADLAEKAAKEKAVNPDGMNIQLASTGYYTYGYDMESGAFTNDFQIGDTISVIVQDEKITARIMQMKIDVSYGKETMTPTLGDVTRGKFHGILTNLANLNSSTGKNDNTKIGGSS